MLMLRLQTVFARFARMQMRYKVLLLIGLASSLYVATLSRNFTGGSIEFVTEIESNDWTVMLQPHKLLIHPLGWIFLHVWQGAGWQGPGLIPLQVFNALAGAVCVGLMYWIAVRVTGSDRAAGLVTVGLGVSGAMWLFSTQAEFVTPPLAETLVVLGGLLAWPRDGDSHYGWAALLGLGVGLSILTYITSVFLVPVVVVGYWFITGQPWQTRLKQIGVFVLAVALTTLPVYAGMLYWVYGVRDLESLRHWQLYGGQGAGTLYGRPALSNLVYGAYTFLHSLASYPGLDLESRTAFYLTQAGWVERGAFGVYYLMVLAGGAIPVALLVIKRKTLSLKHRWTLGVLATWTVLYGAFAFFWVPKDPQFWLPLLVPWWLVVGMLLVMTPSSTSGVRVHERLARWLLAHSTAVVTGMVILLLAVNALGVILPDHELERNQQFQVAQGVGARTGPDDLIVTSGGDKLFLYIPYFVKRQTLSVFGEIMNAGGNKAEALTKIDREIAQAQSLGHHVYLVGTQPGKDVWWDTLNEVGLTKDDFNRFHTAPAWTIGGEEVLEIVP